MEIPEKARNYVINFGGISMSAVTALIEIPPKLYRDFSTQFPTIPA